jgi:uncharacterized protein DUF3891
LTDAPNESGIDYDFLVIVRPAQHGVHLITQPDHAHLAAQIIEHAVTLKAHPRRDQILLAVAEHDNGWAEEDAAPIVNPTTGHPADFVNVPLAVRHRVWPRAIHRLAQHPWPAALVAEHAVVVYDRFRVEDGWTPFFSGLEAARDQMVRTSGLTSTELISDYVYVRLADLISLLFCMAASQPQHVGDWSVQLTGDRVVVTPDPFGGQSIPIEIRAREIPDRTFESDDELRATVRAAPEVIVSGVVSG